jgi:hypothetical protein
MNKMNSFQAIKFKIEGDIPPPHALNQTYPPVMYHFSFKRKLIGSSNRPLPNISTQGSDIKRG